MSFQYTYLFGCLILLIIWIFLFFFKKDTQKEMILISLIFGFAGLCVDPVYSSDWWHPETITNTMPGIESFLFGFTTSGIASIIYPFFLKKKLKEKKKLNLKKEVKKGFNLILIGVLVIIFFFGSYFLFKINSFYSSFPAFLIPVLLIWIKRKDLILNSMISGFLLMIISFAFYIIPELIFSGWISSAWNFEMISGILLLGVPLEDLIWFFLAGLLIGPLYEFWQEKKLK